MQEFIINAILWTLALYGLIEIAKVIRYYFSCTKFKQDGNISTIQILKKSMY